MYIMYVYVCVVCSKYVFWFYVIIFVFVNLTLNICINNNKSMFF